ncbi:leucine-rich repeat-containing protein 15-like [Littorina saxatilis]|uniref:leucine-rich repeat-containing protein 15-like n=1 Tax=Littorina saxatilis TaxID=31220 RepID=UPI0038B520E0
MTSRPRPTQSLSSTLLLSLLCLLLCDVTRGQRCPEDCNCFGSFVACHKFTVERLSSLPNTAQTLVLSSGNISSFPRGFVKQFPQLTFLEIQNTQVETIAEGTFSGVSDLDQLAMTDCRFGIIEAGAFSDMSAVSQFLVSGSQIGTIRTQAFSSLHNVGEFSIWSTTIDTVEPMAFSNLSDFHSFAFYLNNVTTLAKDAFAAVTNFGKVDVYLNRFTSIQGSAVVPLNAATSDMNLYSNVFACECGIVQTFHRPLLLRFLMSQKCLMPGAEVAVRLSEVPLAQMCIDEPTTKTHGKTYQTKTTQGAGKTYPTSTAKTDLNAGTSTPSYVTSSQSNSNLKTTPSKPVTVKNPNQGLSSPSSHGSQHGTTTPHSPAEVSVTSTRSYVTRMSLSSTVEGTHSGSGQNSGELSDGATSLGSGLGSVTQASVVSFLATVTTAWIVSVV